MLQPWTDNLDERQLAVIEAAKVYALHHSAAGLPGHNLLLIIARLANLLTAKETPGVSGWELGQRAYRLYGEVTGGKTYNGQDMLTREALPIGVQRAWIAVGEGMWNHKS